MLERCSDKIHYFSYLLDQSEVMADEHHPSFKFIDSICQSVYCFYVQVVGGLIQEEHVRILPGQPRKAHTALLPIREISNGAHLTNTDTVCSSAGKLTDYHADRKISDLTQGFQQLHDTRGQSLVSLTPRLSFSHQQNKGIPGASAGVSTARPSLY